MTIKVRAEAAQRRFEEGRDSLLRSDGSRYYADTEHEERMAALRRELRETLRTLEEEAEAEFTSARERLTDLENEDLTARLTTEELTSANLRRPFVAEDVAGLSEEALEGRLRSVVGSGDKASMLCHLRASRTKAAETAEGFRLREILGTLERELIGSVGLREREEAGRRVEEATEAKTLVWNLQRGGRDAGAVYRRQAYGNLAERVANSGR